MGKAPKKLSPHIIVWSKIKANPIKSAMLVLGLLGAYPGGVAGAKLIRDQTEPQWYASHDWVREQVDTKLAPIVLAQNDDRKILRDIQIDTANRSKRDEANNLAKWTVERDKAKDRLTIDLIDKQLQASKDAIQALDQQIRTIETLKAQGR